MFLDLFNISTFLIPRKFIPVLSRSMKSRLSVYQNGTGHQNGSGHDHYCDADNDDEAEESFSNGSSLDHMPSSMSGSSLDKSVEASLWERTFRRTSSQNVSRWTTVRCPDPVVSLHAVMPSPFPLATLPFPFGRVVEMIFESELVKMCFQDIVHVPSDDSPWVDMTTYCSAGWITPSFLSWLVDLISESPP